MKRIATDEMMRWLARPMRKPLIVRGARQVGKTWLIREFAKEAGRNLVEINFERQPMYARYFQANDPQVVLNELSLALSREIHPEKSILFLDEVQAAGEIIGKLRWFAEELPQLPVIATGSLLDFALRDHALSMPVGRVEYFYLEPMSFPEYLIAHGQHLLLQSLEQWRHGEPFPLAAHDQASAWFERYAMVGGMPGAVLADIEQSPRECRQIQQDLIAAFRDDFAKYASRMPRHLLDSMLLAVAGSLGKKMVYARAGEGIKTHQAKAAFELLAMARVCHVIRYATASGLPLGGETKDTFRKAILLDVGLLHPLLGTPAGAAFPRWGDLAASVRDQIAQQLAGQQLRVALSRAGDPADLFYWQREGGRPGEIDYLTQAGGHILPIEVKAGSAGAMKSLHQFMFDKRLELAIRIDSNPPSTQDVKVRTTQGNDVAYRLVNVPHYLSWRALSVAAGV